MILLDIPEPKNCDTCIFCDSETGYCCPSTTDGTFFTAKNATKYIPKQTKPDWCPFLNKYDKVEACRKLYDEGYNDGLRAVECMLHVFFKNCTLRPGFGMEKQDIIEVFGTDDYGKIFANNSIKYFLEKTDEWAYKKDLEEEENK